MYNTVVISDLHLFRNNLPLADYLLEFLHFLHESGVRQLILNGDIFDGHHFRSAPESHLAVMDAINSLSASGCQLIYVPGNHDIELRDNPPGWATRPFTDAGWQQTRSYRFCDSRGVWTLALHGDQFDPIKSQKTCAPCEDFADSLYDTLIRTDRLLGFRGNPVIAPVFKGQARQLGGYDSTWKRRMAVFAASEKERVFDRLICGHTHQPGIWTFGSERNPLTLMNSGDWLENGTALLEDETGQWQLMRWAEIRRELGFRRNDAEKVAARFSRLRPQTLRQMDALQSLWGALPGAAEYPAYG